MRVEMNKIGVYIFLFFILLQNAGAQDSIPKSEQKPEKSFLINDDHWSVEVPIWIPGFRGEFAYGDVSLEGEDGGTPEHPIAPGWKPGDHLSRIFGKNGNINFFFMTEISYSNKKIYSHFDMFSASVGSHIKFRYNNKELVSAKFSTYLFRLFVGYQLFEKQSNSDKCNFKLYGYGGLRFHSVKCRIGIKPFRNIG